MNEGEGAQADSSADRRRALMLGGVAIVAAIIGGFIGRSFAPGSHQTQTPRQPIVQIVRPQAGLPSLADTIDKLCPSVGEIVPSGASPAPPPPQPAKSKTPPPVTEAPAFAISSDGWLITSTPLPPGNSYDVVFGDGSRAAVTEIRTDPVSGLSAAKADVSGLAPVTVDDQNYPRIGDFGFALQAPNGSGCSADIAMIGSDFLADGGGGISYVRLQTGAPQIPAGVPFVAGDGSVIGIAGAASIAADALIPSPVASTIIDELIRGSPSPTIAFGFRAADFTAGLSARVGDNRSRGAGVALVEPKSTADKAGLTAGDVIVAVNGSPVSSASELGRALDAAAKTATVTVIRGDQQFTLTLKRSS